MEEKQFLEMLASLEKTDEYNGTLTNGDTISIFATDCYNIVISDENGRAFGVREFEEWEEEMKTTEDFREMVWSINTSNYETNEYLDD